MEDNKNYERGEHLEFAQPLGAALPSQAAHLDAAATGMARHHRAVDVDRAAADAQPDLERGHLVLPGDPGGKAEP